MILFSDVVNLSPLVLILQILLLSDLCRADIFLENVEKKFMDGKIDDAKSLILKKLNFHQTKALVLRPTWYTKLVSLVGKEYSERRLSPSDLKEILLKTSDVCIVASSGGQCGRALFPIFKQYLLEETLNAYLVSNKDTIARYYDANEDETLITALIRACYHNNDSDCILSFSSKVLDFNIISQVLIFDYKKDQVNLKRTLDQLEKSLPENPNYSLFLSDFFRKKGEYKMAKKHLPMAESAFKQNSLIGRVGMIVNLSAIERLVPTGRKRGVSMLENILPEIPPYFVSFRVAVMLELASRYRLNGLIKSTGWHKLVKKYQETKPFLTDDSLLQLQILDSLLGQSKKIKMTKDMDTLFQESEASVVSGQKYEFRLLKSIF